MHVLGHRRRQMQGTRMQCTAWLVCYRARARIWRGHSSQLSHPQMPVAAGQHLDAWAPHRARPWAVHKAKRISSCGGLLRKAGPGHTACLVAALYLSCPEPDMAEHLGRPSACPHCNARACRHLTWPAGDDIVHIDTACWPSSMGRSCALLNA